MAKKQSGKGGKLHRGPFTSADIEKALKRAGFVWEAGGKHGQYRHPDHGGKVSVSANWTSVKPGHQVFKSIARQSKLGDTGLLRVLNGLDP